MLFGVANWLTCLYSNLWNYSELAVARRCYEGYVEFPLGWIYVIDEQGLMLAMKDSNLIIADLPWPSNEIIKGIVGVRETVVQGRDSLPQWGTW